MIVCFLVYQTNKQVLKNGILVSKNTALASIKRLKCCMTLFSLSLRSERNNICATMEMYVLTNCVYIDNTEAAMVANVSASLTSTSSHFSSAQLPLV